MCFDLVSEDWKSVRTHAHTYTHTHTLIYRIKVKKQKLFYEEASTLNLKIGGLATVSNVSPLTCHVHIC